MKRGGRGGFGNKSTRPRQPPPVIAVGPVPPGQGMSEKTVQIINRNLSQNQKQVEIKSHEMFKNNPVAFLSTTSRENSDTLVSFNAVWSSYLKTPLYIATVPKDTYAEFFPQFQQNFPNYFNNNTLNFANFHQNNFMPSNFLHMSMLLFSSALLTRDKFKQIEKINLERIRLSKISVLSNLKTFFPNIKTVVLNGNRLNDFDQKDSVLPNVKVIYDGASEQPIVSDSDDPFKSLDFPDVTETIIQPQDLNSNDFPEVSMNGDFPDVTEHVSKSFVSDNHDSPPPPMAPFHRAKIESIPLSKEFKPVPTISSTSSSTSNYRIPTVIDSYIETNVLDEEQQITLIEFVSSMYSSENKEYFYLPDAYFSYTVHPDLESQCKSVLLARNLVNSSTAGNFYRDILGIKGCYQSLFPSGLSVEKEHIHIAISGATSYSIYIDGKTSSLEGIPYPLKFIQTLTIFIESGELRVASDHITLLPLACCTLLD